MSPSGAASFSRSELAGLPVNAATVFFQSVYGLLGLTFAIGIVGFILATSLGAPEWVMVPTALPTLLGPPLAYITIERFYRSNWRRALPAVQRAHEGAYREVAVVPGYSQRAPLEVRLLAMSCYALGIAFIPGLALGLIGLFAVGIGIVSIPGLWIASEIWRAGRSLLSGEAAALAQVRRVANGSLILNVGLAILAACGILWESQSGSGSGNGEATRIIGLPLLAYVAISILHALWLRRVAARRSAELETVPTA